MLFHQMTQEMKMTINEVEESISYLKAKIEKQGTIVNERDANHLDSLNQLYLSLLMKEGRVVIDDTGQVYDPLNVRGELK